MKIANTRNKKFLFINCLIDSYTIVLINFSRRTKIAARKIPPLDLLQHFRYIYRYKTLFNCKDSDSFLETFNDCLKK